MKGILMVNLGSPESPTAKDVKPYLDEFLMDKYVIDYPYILRALLVKGIILRSRPKASAEAYEKIWWEEGSPLIVLSRRLKEAVTAKLSAPVALAMRYGKPSLEEGLDELAAKGVDHVLVVPLYPQYAMATTRTIVEKIEEIRSRKFPFMLMEHFAPFYNKPEYARVLSQSIKDALNGFQYDHILFSYHGVPERHIRKTDPTGSHCHIDSECCSLKSTAHQFCYRHQCYETTRAVAEILKLPAERYSVTFQSRLGRDKWLEPYTDKRIAAMPAEGIKNLAVVTPAFVSDCIETLEEIAMRAKDDFLGNGGKNFITIPCLNDREDWTDAVAGWISDWVDETTQTMHT